MTLVDWCNRGIRAGFYLLFISVPIFLTPVNYELFEYNKMMLTYGITAAIATLWLIKMVQTRNFAIRRTPLDIPITLFFVSQLISTLFSMDPHVSWNGYYSRFNGGLWSTITYIVLFYAFVSNWNEQHIARDLAESKDAKDHKTTAKRGFAMLPLLKVAVATGVAVSVYGVLQRMGIDKHLWVQDVQTRVFSTLGQPNWLAAYLVALAPVALVIGLKQKRTHILTFSAESIQFFLWSGIAILFYLVLLFTRSRSGLLAFAAADIILWAVLYLKSKNIKTLAYQAVFIHGVFLLITFINGSNIAAIDKHFSWSAVQSRLESKTTAATAVPEQPQPGTSIDYGGTESGTIRTYVWQGAINAWRSSPKTMLVGTGVETFAFAFFQYKPVGHNVTSEWDFLYNKAHNEYLNYLTTTGVIGLGTYLLLIVTILWVMAKPQLPIIGKGAKSATFPVFLITGYTAGFVSILITNFFGFSVVVVQILFYLLPAMTIVLSDALEGVDENERMWVLPRSVAQKYGKPMIGIIGVAGIGIIGYLVLLWHADKLFAAGYRASRSGNPEAAITFLQRAVALNGREPLYRDELGVTLASFASQALAEGQATAASEIAAEAIAQSDRALDTSPNNVNFWKSRTKIYYAFSEYDAQFNALAITALEQAHQLSPLDPKIAYNLAILQGRAGDNQKAIDTLKEALTYKPDYRDTYFALYIFYKELGRTEDARQILTTYLETIGPDADFIQRLEEL